RSTSPRTRGEAQRNLVLAARFFRVRVLLTTPSEESRRKSDLRQTNPAVEAGFITIGRDA
ncbi:MAG: hypothetical protein WA837_01010, partial [Xanthobacteraceae bacterium]